MGNAGRPVGYRVAGSVVVVAAKFRGLAVAALGLGCGATCSAAIQLSHFPPDPGVLPGGGWEFKTGTTFAQPTPPRAWVNGVYGSVPKIVATDAMTVAGKAGPLAVAVAQRVGVAEAAGAVARCIAGSVPICAVGTAAAIAYELYRIHAADDFPGTQASPGELAFDPGTSTVTVSGTVYCFTSGTLNQQCFPTVQAAAAAQAAAFTSASTQTSCYYGGQFSYYTSVYSVSETRTTPTPGFKLSWNSKGAQCQNITQTDTNWRSLLAQTQQVTQCPASIDASNPAYDVPAGGAPGFDGKCPTARYNHAPISQADAAAKVAAYPGDWTSNGTGSGGQWRDALRDAIDTGGQQAPADVVTSGPGSQTGTPTTTTTTTPQGTTTTTTQNTYNYTYNGPTVTYDTVTNTYTCTGAGACSSSNATTTTTTTQPSNPTAPDPESECAKNPDTVGCMKPGTPSDVDLQTDEQTVTFNPDGGWGAADAACPAPRVVEVLGQSVTIDNSLVCDFMSGIRFAVIGACGILAAMLFVGGLRS